MSYIFFLGGKDAEMARIADVLSLNGHEFVDKKLTCNAHAEDYANEIAQAIENKKIIVLVEVCNLHRPVTKDSKEKNKILLPKDSILISHKMDFNREYESLIQSSEALIKKNYFDVNKASLLRVLALIKIKPTRLDMLIAANDMESIQALIQMKATPSEIREVRNKQRRALGITMDEELEAEEAVFHLEYSNTLTIVRVKTLKLSMISGCSAITDRLCYAAGGVGWTHLLILQETSNEAIYFGSGDICYHINREFMGQRNIYAQIFGGRGYWGGYPNHNELISFISGKIEAQKCA